MGSSTRPASIGARHASTVNLSDEAIARLFEQESAKLWRSLLLHAADPEIASDAAAEAFAQLIRARAGVRDARAWLWRVAFRLADRELASRSRPHPIDQTAYDMPEPVIDLIRALAKLSPMQRRAVVLHHLADWSVAQVASVLGTSRSAVTVHLHRGRRRLRELLEDRDDRPA
jgi:RNA polymerase sigma-70 factor (ECF subfamily)